MTDAPFVPGLRLCRAFYLEVVRPIIDDAFPGLQHAAAILGTGSEVLGLDDARSTDHHWGPRAMLFLDAEDLRQLGDRIDETLAMRLPPAFMGYSTNFAAPIERGTRLLEPVAGPPIAHRVELLEPTAFFDAMLGFDPRRRVTTADWLFTPSQRLLEVTSGEVFHDALGALTSARAALAGYPRDVWLYAIAQQWQRIAEEEPFVGRTQERSDEIGVRIQTARLVRDVMRLCFLLERRYAPYAKWLGTAFARLACAPSLSALLERATATDDNAEREQALCDAYETVARMHNALGITPPVEPTVRLFYSRPFRVLRAERFADAAIAAIDPAALRKLRQMHVPGTIDQWADNTALLSDARHWRALRAAFARRGREHDTGPSA